MTLQEAMAARHSVRRYQNKPIPQDILQLLSEEAFACNAESGLHIQLAVNEGRAFGGLMAHYGKFHGVQNYIALVGKEDETLWERCGYYGQRMVLRAQQLGLNTCWVALTYRKVPEAFHAEADERLAAVIALGYGETHGKPRKSKTALRVSNLGPDTPPWFAAGVEAALLAPTAMNQQAFRLTYRDGKVHAKAGLGFYSNMDLGIVKYQFELGAGKDHHIWI